MDPVDRLLRALSHQKVDRPPVTGLMTAVTVQMMDAAGAKWPEAHHDPSAMAKLAAAAHETCGLESMKMENELKSPADGVVKSIHFGPGDLVGTGQPIIRLEPDE